MSQSSSKLSLFAAIIININIMAGAGLFINTAELAKRAGALGALSYVLIGILLLPLVLSFVKLIELNPTGGFFSFSAHSIHPVVGFLSTWSYFIAKISSATLVIHVFVTIMQKIFPTIACYDSFTFDSIILCIILCFNMFNVRTGSTIQNWLMILKLFPILFAILTGLFFLQGAHLLPIHYIWSGIPSTIPLVLHAMLGFEAACSISRNLQNPKKDGPRAVLFSYAIVVILAALYQICFYGILGSVLTEQTNYSTTFPLLVNHYSLTESIRTTLAHLIHIAIATSAFSAAFGIIYTNLWNLFTLAEKGYTCAPTFIMKLNRYKVPFICVLIQGAISWLYMLIIRGDQITFQQLSAFGSTVNYSLCIFGLFATLYARKQSVLLPTLALINCAVLLSASLYTMWWSSNATPLYIFIGLIFFALLMFWKSTKKQHIVLAMFLLSLSFSNQCMNQSSISSWWSTPYQSAIITTIKNERHQLTQQLTFSLNIKLTKYIIPITMQLFTDLDKPDVNNNNHKHLFLQYAYYQKHHENEKSSGVANLKSWAKKNVQFVQGCINHTLNGYSAVGAAIIAEDITFETKKLFIQQLLKIGFTPTKNDRKFEILNIWERDIEINTRILLLKLISKQLIDHFPQEIVQYIITIMISDEKLL